jgi:hypothetical protein
LIAAGAAQHQSQQQDQQELHRVHDPGSCHTADVFSRGMGEAFNTHGGNAQHNNAVLGMIPEASEEAVTAVYEQQQLAYNQVSSCTPFISRKLPHSNLILAGWGHRMWSAEMYHTALQHCFLATKPSYQCCIPAPRCIHLLFYTNPASESCVQPRHWWWE